MELKQLEYFMVACEKGSFNQAAECLYTSQPNVSKVIGMLEQELGRALFERTSRAQGYPIWRNGPGVCTQYFKSCESY